MSVYYQDDAVTLYHGDCRDHLELIAADVLVSDVPYGIDYRSNQRRQSLARSIAGDKDTSVRDEILAWWSPRPALIFGTWRAPRPADTRALLVWDTKGALGMGAMDLPWKPAHQEIYVLGKGFTGRRDTDVLCVAPVQSLGYNGRTHPHEKPVELMRSLIDKCPPGVVLDPFAGTGSTLRAAKDLGRRAIGVEIEERYCEVIAKRLAQDVLDFGGITRKDDPCSDGSSEGTATSGTTAHEASAAGEWSSAALAEPWTSTRSMQVGLNFGGAA